MPMFRETFHATRPDMIPASDGDLRDAQTDDGNGRQ